MADKPADKNLLPRLLQQNPSPVGQVGQARILARREQVDRIMEVFLQMLPSNYVAQVQGPFYTVQFQTVAEILADFQISAQETFADFSYDYMRPEFLFQLLGSLVFPDAPSDGYPSLKGDLTYREFLKRMVTLLLQGATKATVEGGLDLLFEATWQVIEKGLAARDEKKRVWNESTNAWETVAGAAWGVDDQFEFEVNVSYTDPTTGTQRFPVDPFLLQENVRIFLRALKPAHTLYDYRHPFVEAFGVLFDDTQSWDLANYHYDDFRKFCCGAKQVSGTNGVTWTAETLFNDTTRDFSQISPGAELTVTSGPNGIHSGGVEGTPASMDARPIGRYRVINVLNFSVPMDTTPRSYTTSPTGFSGTAIVVDGGVVEDPAQDFGSVVEGEVLTFTTGPNQGAYRLKMLLGTNGGPVGETTGPATRVRVAPCLLRLDRRMRYVTSGQAYTVAVDRLGVQVPHSVAGEDATAFFLL